MIIMKSQKSEIEKRLDDIWEVLEVFSKRIVELNDSVNANSLLLSSLAHWISGEPEHEC
jgi:hypothetical protein